MRRPLASMASPVGLDGPPIRLDGFPARLELPVRIVDAPVGVVGVLPDQRHDQRDDQRHVMNPSATIRLRVDQRHDQRDDQRQRHHHRAPAACRPAPPEHTIRHHPPTSRAMRTVIELPRGAVAATGRRLPARGRVPRRGHSPRRRRLPRCAARARRRRRFRPLARPQPRWPAVRTPPPARMAVTCALSSPSAAGDARQTTVPANRQHVEPRRSRASGGQAERPCFVVGR